MNQDAVLAGPRIFAVADGMGGHAAGDVASSLAVATLARAAGEDQRLSAGDVLAAVEEANRRILAEAEGGREGMGTTLALVAAVASEEAGADSLALVNIGDSRIYRLPPDGGQLEQMTQDHSVVAELLAAGEITADEARTHPERNAITRVLGLHAGAEVDHWTRRAVPGERFLLCSDGLVNELGDDEIGEVLRTTGSPSAAAERLLERALDAGAVDNVSVVIVDVVGVGEDEMAPSDDTQPTSMASSDTLPRA